MSLLDVKVPKERKNEPLERNKYDAVVHAIIDLGRHPRPQMEGDTRTLDPVNFVKIVFEIPNATSSGESKFLSMKRLNVSLYATSRLTKVLTTLFEVETNKEVEAIMSAAVKKGENPFEEVLGKAVQVHLTSFTRKDGSIQQLVNEIAILDPRLPKPEATEEPFTFLIARDDAPEVFKTRLTKAWATYVQDDIIKSLDADKFPPKLQQAIVEVLENREQDRVQSPKTTSSNSNVLGD